LAGDPALPIDYAVDRMRDGGSFTTRRVAAIQNGRPIFELMASYHRTEAGLHHQVPMGDVPPPEDLLPAGELLAQPD
ncbi:acyl-CoA thioesterase domain-containing protein, partial [Acinetobacter baumannii]